MSDKVSIYYIDNNEAGGYDVATSVGDFDNVHHNVVRCAVGDDDLDYLVQAEGYQPEGSFTICKSEAEDFAKYKDKGY